MTEQEAEQVYACISNSAYDYAREFLFPFIKTLSREQGRLIVMHSTSFAEKGPSAKEEVIDQIWEWK